MNEIKKHKKYNHLVDLCEVEMAKAPIDLEPVHRFYPGIYIRELFIPKGVLLTSKIHLTDHAFLVTEGVINILTEEGVVQMKAPFEGLNKAGTRRVGYAVEDTRWLTIHPNEDNCSNLAIIESRLFKNYKNKLLQKATMEVIK